MRRGAILVGVIAALVSPVSAAPASAIEFGPPVTVNAPESEPGYRPPWRSTLPATWWSRGSTRFRRRVRGLPAPRRLVSEPRLLSSSRRTEATDVDVAITASGEALVAWTENETLAALGRARARVVVASRAATGTRFGAPQELSLRQQGAHTSSLATTPGGEAVAVWEELRTLTGPIRIDSLRVSGSIRLSGGTWSAPVALSDTQRRFTSGVSTPQRERMVPRVALLPSGAALAVWERASGATTTCCQRIEAAVRPAGGAFGPAELLTEATERDFAVLRDVKGSGTRWGALGWNGSALLLFERSETSAFAPPLSVPGALGEFTEAALALAPDGAATLVKGVPLATGAPCESVGGVYALASTSRSAGGAFGPDHPLTAATRPGAHAAAAHAGSRAVLGWEQPRRSAIEEGEPGGCNFVGSKPLGADGAPGSTPDRA